MIEPSKTLFPASAIDKNSILYYVTHYEHIIKKLDLSTGEVEYIDSPKEFDLKFWDGIDKLFWCNDILYLFEQNGKRILKYSLLEKVSKCINLNCTTYLWDNWVSCSIYNNCIFAFQSFANQVVKIDFQANRVKKQKIGLEISYNFEQENEIYTFENKKLNIPHKLYSCSYQIGNDIWLFTEKLQVVVKYNLITEKGIKCELPDEIKGCIHAVWYKKIFYILSIDGNVFSWNYLNNHVVCLFDSKGEFQYPFFYKLAITDKNIWILPSLGKDIFVIDLENLKEKKYSAYPEDFCYIGGSSRSKYYGYSEDIMNYYFAMHSANYLLIINKTDGKAKWIRPKEPDFNKQINYYQKKDRIQFEKAELGLKEFIFFTSERDRLEIIKEKQIGKFIWNIF